VPTAASQKPASTPKKTLRFRGRSFMALVLAPEPPIEDWLAEVDALATRSPGFFSGRPVILEISAMPKREAGIVAMVAELKKRDLRIVGIEGTDISWLDSDGLPPILTGGRAASTFVELASKRPEPALPSAVAPAPAASAPAPEPALRVVETHSHAAPIMEAAAPEPTSLLVKEPIRSGQSIYFPNGDVTVVGAIASGAEVVAGGSIHVYGTLRGRAIAGCNGNSSAQIFCRKLDPELLAIDGFYKAADDMDAKYRGRPVQVRLNGDAIVMEVLS
jgi:septum site-determining protein MinC